MAAKGSKKITVRKTLHMRHAFVASMGYVSSTKPILMERVWAEYDGGGNWERGKLIERRSTDNGRTWKVLGEIKHAKTVGNRVHMQGSPNYYLDKGRGVLVDFFSRGEAWADKDVADFGPNAMSDYLPYRTGRVFYRISRDEGVTWGPVKQIIQKGKGYDSVHWADGIWYEKNGASFGELHRTVLLADGSVLLPIGVTLLDKRRKLIKWPDRFGYEIWPVEGAACLRGRWRKDSNDLDWEISNHLSAPEYMTRGLCEPAVAGVADGRLMMIMRGCSSARQSLSGVKFFSISKDDGLTWGPVVPLTYPDASHVHSPGSLPNFFRSSKNGKLYLIANILPSPCWHCDPRYPLTIAEVDPTYYWVIPETITVIDDRKKHHSDRVRFSNWQRIEDRETGNPVIFMTEGREDDIIPGTEGTQSPDSHRYEIQLPD